MRILSLVIVLMASTQSFAEDPQASKPYYDKIDEVNQHLQDIQNMRSSFLCPGSEMVLSCGNGKCEPETGEDEVSCPADCIVSPVKSYDFAMVCREVQQFFTPSSTSEVQSLIKYAANANVGVRVVGNRHTVNDQYCTNGIVLSTAKLNHVLGIVKEPDGSESVWTEPGVVMGDLAEWLHKKQRSLGYVVLGFRMATVGGAIGTGAHGSSTKHTAVISNIVRAVTIVDGQGNIREISDADGETDTMRAVRTHLGLLGAVVRVKLRIIPQFRLDTRVTYSDDDNLVSGKGVFDEVAGCDFGIINWFPNTHHLVKTCGVETTKRAETSAENVLLQPKLPQGLTQPYKVALHYGMCYDPINEGLEALRYLTLWFMPPLQKDYLLGQISSTTQAIGYSHRMISSKLIETTGKFFTNDWEFAVPYSQAQNAIQAVSDYARDNGMYLPLVGVFLRFAPSEDKALLAHTTSTGLFIKGEPVVFIEFPTPAPVGFSPRMAADVNKTYEGLAQLLVTQLGARPHWGKNEDFAFALENQLDTFGDNLEKFKAVRRDFDPQGLFLTAFSQNANLN